MTWVSSLPEYAVALGGPAFVGYEVGKRINLPEKWDGYDTSALEFFGLLVLSAVSVIVAGVASFEFTTLFPGGGDGWLAILSSLTYLGGYVAGSIQKSEA